MQDNTDCATEVRGSAASYTLALAPGCPHIPISN